MMDAMRGNSNGIDVVNVFASEQHVRNATVPDTDVPPARARSTTCSSRPDGVTYQGCAAPTICARTTTTATHHRLVGSTAGLLRQHAMADFFSGCLKRFTKVRPVVSP